MKELKRPGTQLREQDFKEEDEDMPEIFNDAATEKAELEVAEQYSDFLGRLLERSLAQGRYDALIVCAEHRLLGIFRSKLPQKVHKRLTGVIELDLYDINETDLVPYLRDVKKTGHAA